MGREPSALTCLAGIFPSKIKRDPSAGPQLRIQKRDPNVLTNPISSPGVGTRQDSCVFQVTALPWPKQLGWKRESELE